MLKEIFKIHQQKEINDTQLLMLNNEWQSFTDICGACERIKNTPIPYSYSAFIKKFIFLYVITMPFGFAITLGLYTIPVTIFIFYILASLELIAEEIEDPFGNDSNDLPMEKITENIKRNIQEILS
jgi:putative membrane protein